MNRQIKVFLSGGGTWTLSGEAATCWFLPIDIRAAKQKSSPNQFSVFPPVPIKRLLIYFTPRLADLWGSFSLVSHARLKSELASQANSSALGTESESKRGLLLYTQTIILIPHTHTHTHTHTNINFVIMQWGPVGVSPALDLYKFDNDPGDMRRNLAILFTAFLHDWRRGSESVHAGAGLERRTLNTSLSREEGGYAEFTWTLQAPPPAKIKIKTLAHCYSMFVHPGN